MKTLKQMGISPWPWNAGGLSMYKYIYSNRSPKDGEREIIGDAWSEECEREDARLMAASPELYDCLREAVVEMCHVCEDTNLERCKGKCFVARWREALAKASGDEI